MENARLSVFSDSLRAHPENRKNAVVCEHIFQERGRPVLRVVSGPQILLGAIRWDSFFAKYVAKWPFGFSFYQGSFRARYS